MFTSLDWAPVFAVVVAVVIAPGPAPPLAAPSDWVGADKCKACHAEAFEAWRAGPHARAAESLGQDRRRQECLGCHATGDAPAGKAMFAAVQCEACHGAGAGYSEDDIMRDRPLRAALGLVDLSTPTAQRVVCRRCHHQELRALPFDSERAWRRLAHSRGAGPLKPKSAELLTAASGPGGFPDHGLAEFAFAGRSNCGKSSLLNMVVGKRNLARTSNKPGRTRLIFWFRVAPQKGPPIALVDLPGYGYAKVPKEMRDSWRPLVESYLHGRESLRAVLVLIDVRRGAGQEERDLLAWLAAESIEALVVLTKIDKLPKSKRKPAVLELKRELGLKREPIATSAQTREGLAELWRFFTRMS